MLWLAVIDRSFKLQHAAQLCIYTEVFAHFARTMAASSIHISKYKYSSRQVRIVGAQSNPTIMARRLSSMENRKRFLLISLLLFSSLSVCASTRLCLWQWRLPAALPAHSVGHCGGCYWPDLHHFFTVCFDVTNVCSPLSATFDSLPISNSVLTPVDVITPFWCGWSNNEMSRLSLLFVLSFSGPLVVMVTDRGQKKKPDNQT